MPLALVRRHWPAAVGLLAPLALAAALYAPTLRRPYFWDDFPLFNFAYSNACARLWTDVTGLPYYRPITLTLYKLIWDGLPPGATLWPRLALLGPGANALLTGWLVGALTSVVYPFGALPVAHLAAVHHPAVTLFTLGGAASTVAYARSGRRRWLVLAPYLNVLDLVYFNTDRRLKAEVATFPDLRPALRWHYLSTANEGPSEMWNAAVFTTRAPAYDHVWLTTYTEHNAVLEEVGNVFSHGVDCAGTMLGNMLDFASLSAGARIYDVRRILLEALPPDGCLQAPVGLFLGDGSRLTVHDAGGADLPEQAYPVRR